MHASKTTRQNECNKNMTTITQFNARAKMRHDYSDMIQVRYPHPNGENFDTWVSGEEIMARLKTQDRERLIKSFSQKDLPQTRAALKKEAQKGMEAAKKKARRSFKDRLADVVGDQIGGNIFGDTLADNIRGVDSNVDPRERERQQWQNRLRDKAFRAMALELAWIDLAGTMPDEGDEAEPDDWI